MLLKNARQMIGPFERKQISVIRGPTVTVRHFSKSMRVLGGVVGLTMLVRGGGQAPVAPQVLGYVSPGGETEIRLMGHDGDGDGGEVRPSPGELVNSESVRPWDAIL